MTWRTGTQNPHTLYLDSGGVSLPQGFIMNPGAARAIVAAMNAGEGRPGAGSTDTELLRQARDELRTWLRQLCGSAPRDATQDAVRLDPLILALDERLREGT